MNETMTISEQAWTCPVCGKTMDICLKPEEGGICLYCYHNTCLENNGHNRK